EMIDIRSKSYGYAFDYLKNLYLRRYKMINSYIESLFALQKKYSYVSLLKWIDFIIAFEEDYSSKRSIIRGKGRGKSICLSMYSIYKAAYITGITLYPYGMRKEEILKAKDKGIDLIVRIDEKKALLNPEKEELKEDSYYVLSTKEISHQAKLPQEEMEAIRVCSSAIDNSLDKEEFQKMVGLAVNLVTNFLKLNEREKRRVISNFVKGFLNSSYEEVKRLCLVSLLDISRMDRELVLDEVYKEGIGIRENMLQARLSYLIKEIILQSKEVSLQEKLNCANRLYLDLVIYKFMKERLTKEEFLTRINEEFKIMEDKIRDFSYMFYDQTLELIFLFSKTSPLLEGLSYEGFIEIKEDIKISLKDTRSIEEVLAILSFMYQLKIMKNNQLNLLINIFNEKEENLKKEIKFIKEIFTIYKFNFTFFSYQYIFWISFSFEYNKFYTQREFLKILFYLVCAFKIYRERKKIREKAKKEGSVLLEIESDKNIAQEFADVVSRYFQENRVREKRKIIYGGFEKIKELFLQRKSYILSSSSISLISSDLRGGAKDQRKVAYPLPRWKEKCWRKSILAYLSVAGWGQGISSFVFQRGVAAGAFLPAPSFLKNKKLDLVIGVPFAGVERELKSLVGVLRITKNGMEKYYPNLSFSFVVVGSYRSEKFRDSLEKKFEKENIPGEFIILEKNKDGKRWVIRKLIEFSKSKDADLIILEADLLRKKREGIQPEWIKYLYEPVKEAGFEFVFPVFRRVPEGRRITDHIVRPVLITLFGYRIEEPLGGVYAINKNIFDIFLDDEKLFAKTDIGGYGIDIYLCMKAIVNDLKICQAYLGTKLQIHSPGWYKYLTKSREMRFLSKLPVQKPYLVQSYEIIDLIYQSLKFPDEIGFMKDEELDKFPIQKELVRKTNSLLPVIFIASSGLKNPDLEKLRDILCKKGIRIAVIDYYILPNLSKKRKDLIPKITQLFIKLIEELSEMTDKYYIDDILKNLSEEQEDLILDIIQLFIELSKKFSESEKVKNKTGEILQILSQEKGKILLSILKKILNPSNKLLDLTRELAKLEMDSYSIGGILVNLSEKPEDLVFEITQELLDLSDKLPRKLPQGVNIYWIFYPLSLISSSGKFPPVDSVSELHEVVVNLFILPLPIKIPLKKRLELFKDIDSRISLHSLPKFENINDLLNELGFTNPSILQQTTRRLLLQVKDSQAKKTYIYLKFAPFKDEISHLQSESLTYQKLRELKEEGKLDNYQGSIPLPIVIEGNYVFKIKPYSDKESLPQESGNRLPYRTQDGYYVGMGYIMNKEEKEEIFTYPDEKTYTPHKAINHIKTLLFFLKELGIAYREILGLFHNFEIPLRPYNLNISPLGIIRGEISQLQTPNIRGKKGTLVDLDPQHYLKVKEEGINIMNLINWFREVCFQIILISGYCFRKRKNAEKELLKVIEEGLIKTLYYGVIGKNLLKEKPYLKEACKCCAKEVIEEMRRQEVYLGSRYGIFPSQQMISLIDYLAVRMFVDLLHTSSPVRFLEIDEEKLNIKIQSFFSLKKGKSFINVNPETKSLFYSSSPVNTEEVNNKAKNSIFSFYQQLFQNPQYYQNIKAQYQLGLKIMEENLKEVLPKPMLEKLISVVKANAPPKRKSLDKIDLSFLPQKIQPQIKDLLFFLKLVEILSSIKENNQAYYKLQARFFDYISDILTLDKFPPSLKQRLKSIVEKAQVRPESVILDVGAGTGVLFPYFAKYKPSKVIASEVSGGMIEKLKENYQKLRSQSEKVFELEIHQKDITILLDELEENSIDYIFFNAVWPNLKEKKKIIEKAFRVLKKNGKIIISHPEGRKFVNNRLKHFLPFLIDKLPERGEIKRLIHKPPLKIERFIDENIYFVFIEKVSIPNKVKFSSSSIDEKLAEEMFSLLYGKEISLDSTSSSLEDVTIRKKLERDCILLLVGMFNPFTKAMERMIDEAKKIKEFEKVVLVLTRAPPHRKIWGASFEDRLSMLKKYAEEKGYKVVTSDKYLYLDILKEIKRICPSKKVTLLLGINSLRRIFSWDYSDIPNALDNLFNKCEFIVVERDKDSLTSFIQANPKFRKYLSKISTITLPKECQKISSAQARMACFNNNLPLLKKIVPKVIAEYIEENMLYRKVKLQALRDVLSDPQLFEEYKRQMFESYSVRDGKGRVIQDIVERVKSMLEAGKKVSILSVGAGQGIDLAYIKDSLNKYKGLLELVGLDVNPQMVDSAKIQDSSIMYINENVLEADMKQLEKRFDIVFAINVIHEIVPELAKDKETGEINFSCIPVALRHLLQIMKSYLKENGEIIIYEGRAESVDEKDKWITVKFKNEDTRNRFLRFAQKYQPKKIVYKTQENKPNQIQMPYGDFMRAVSYYLYMYTRREEIEMEELWQYISIEDIVKILFDEEFKHINLETFTPKRQLDRWQKDMDIDGDWPDIIMYVRARLMDKTEVIDENKASLLLPTVEPDVYKNKQGKIAVLAGDVEYTGAFLLSLKSALRSGAGKVFAVGLKNCLDSLNIPDEVIKRRFDKIEDIFNFINEEGIDSILFGPGISQAEVNEEILLRLLKSFSGVLVLDAGALYLAKKHLSAIRRTKASVIITPHKGEMAFLISAPSISESERISKARKFAIATNLVVVLKGSEQFPTIVVNKNGDYAVNTVGNRYMAKAGMGDVLAGIIAGIGAVKYAKEIKYAKESEYAKKRRKEERLAYECAMLGVYVHSYAGDIAAEDLKDALIASDVINCVGKAFRKLRQIEQKYILRDSRKEISLKEVYRLLSCYPFFDRYLLKRLKGEGRVSNVFSIYNKNTGKSEFVLKFSPWNRQGAIWEGELLRFLKQKDRNLPIPEVINTQEGSLLCIHGGRPAILYKYVSGVKVKERELSENMIYEAAKWLARLHSIGWKDNFVPIFGGRVYDKVGEFKGKNDRRFEKIHEAKRKYERLSEKGRAEELFLEYFDFFVELMETVEREFLPLYNRLLQCVIHGDYTLENILWSEEKSKIVLISDWDTARHDVRIFDIVRAHSFYSLLDENNELDLSSFNKWLIAYQKEAQKLGIGITKEEIKAVKYMFMILFAYQYQWLIRFENNELVNTNDAEYQEFIHRFITARLIVDYTWNEWEEIWEGKVSSPIQKEVLIKEFIISTSSISLISSDLRGGAKDQRKVASPLPRWKEKRWRKSILAYLSVAGWGQGISSFIFQRGVAAGAFLPTPSSSSLENEKLSIKIKRINLEEDLNKYFLRVILYLENYRKVGSYRKPDEKEIKRWFEDMKGWIKGYPLWNNEVEKELKEIFKEIDASSSINFDIKPEAFIISFYQQLFQNPQYYQNIKAQYQLGLKIMEENLGEALPKPMLEKLISVVKANTPPKRKSLDKIDLSFLPQKIQPQIKDLLIFLKLVEIPSSIKENNQAYYKLQARFFDYISDILTLDKFPPSLKQRLKSIVEKAQIRPESVILDVGAGTGVLLPYFIKYMPSKVIASEVSGGMIEKLKENYFKIFKVSLAVRTLKGRFLRVKKCLFSVTNTSAPTHSVYAAIKASAGFNPKDSYLAPISKGTKISSSILVNLFIEIINSLKASVVRLLRTSSTINRGIRREISSLCSIIFSRSFTHTGSRTLPRAKIYSLLSRTSSKLLPPEFFSIFTDLVDNFLLTHSLIGRFNLRHKFAYSLKSPFNFSHILSIFPHCLLTSFITIPSLLPNVKKAIASSPVHSKENVKQLPSSSSVQRIVVYNPQSNIGGIKSYADTQVELLGKKGIEVCYLGALSKLYEEIKEELRKLGEIDLVVVHSLGLPTELAFLNFAKENKISLVTFYHGREWEIYLFNQPIYIEANKVCVVSKAAIEAVNKGILEGYLPPSYKEKFVYAGPLVNPIFFKEHRFGRNALRRELEIGEREFVIFNPNRPTLLKGINEIVKIISRLRDDFEARRIERKPRLLVVDKEEIPSKIHTSINAGLREYVILRDFVSPEEMLKLYALSDIVVLFSYEEGAPLVLAEAQAMGIPPIAIRVGGVEEVIKYEANIINGSGVIVDWYYSRAGVDIDKTVDMFVNCIRFLISKPEILEKMGKNAKKFAQKFHPELMIERQMEIFDRVIEEYKRSGSALCTTFSASSSISYLSQTEVVVENVNIKIKHSISSFYQQLFQNPQYYQNIKAQYQLGLKIMEENLKEALPKPMLEKLISVVKANAPPKRKPLDKIDLSFLPQELQPQIKDFLFFLKLVVFKKSASSSLKIEASGWIPLEVKKYVEEILLKELIEEFGQIKAIRIYFEECSDEFLNKVYKDEK
ncbi:MAG: hypothetical protein B6D55_03685, partial [Candidatus Omnitrophica bacterium 4484_70.2]